MKSYNIPKGKRRGQSKRVTFEDPLIKMLSTFFVLAIGMALAGMLALKLY